MRFPHFLQTISKGSGREEGKGPLLKRIANRLRRILSMSDTPHKHTYLEGTALLAMATAIVKVIGALYKIPLNAIIGAKGFGYFNTAYDIFNVLLMVSTAGLPVAMSRMIAQADSLGHQNQVRRIYATARGIFLGLGISGSVLMTLFCRQLAAFQNQPDAWAAIGALGPTVLFICLMSAYRGFFQGQGDMAPTSVSQVIEAVTKLLVGMGAALLMLKATGSIPLAAGGAILGVTVSCLVSTLYLARCFRNRFASLPHTSEEPRSYLDTAKGLMIIAVPITLGSAGMQVMTMMETKIFMGRLLMLGYAQAEADTMRGIYGMCLTIFNMPCAFIPAITISIIPAITTQLTKCRNDRAKEIEESSARIMGLIAMPCAMGLAVLSVPVAALLGGYQGANLALAGRMLSVLGLAIFFDSVVMVTTAIMQAHGYAGRPVINMLLGGLVNLVAVYVLAGNPHIHIVGTPIGILVGYVTISALNLFSLRTLLEEPPAIVPNLMRSLAASAIMGAAVWGTWKAMIFAGIGGRLLPCAVPVAVGVVVYALCVVRLHCITREDCMLLPKGEKIAKIMKL